MYSTAAAAAVVVDKTIHHVREEYARMYDDCSLRRDLHDVAENRGGIQIGAFRNIYIDRPTTRSLNVDY